MTQKLFEACSRQGDYRIPQLQEKNAQVPKTEAGEDLGVGDGWWYQGLFSGHTRVFFLHRVIGANINTLRFFHY